MSALTREAFDAWATCSLFSLLDETVALRQVGEHAPGHGIECPVCGSRFERVADDAKIGAASDGQRQQQMTKHFLDYVQDVYRFTIHDSGSPILNAGTTPDKG